MSKKKAVNTMTLKDFHGGSIPSDLPLPSAPGVVVRPSSDHRQSAWGGSVSRSEHRILRPSSSGSMRSNLDDKTPFLTSNVNIGRNFDEDERKPLDGGNVNRRTVSDDDYRRPVLRHEERVDVGRVPSREGLGSGVGSGGGGSYSARVVEGGNVGGGVRTGAWGVRKETVSVNEVVLNPWGGGGQSSSVSKFAQASALDQITSGRWQTKPVQHQVDIEVIRQSDSPSGLYGRESEFYGGGVIVGSERESYDTTLVRHVERGLVMDGVPGGVTRVRSPDVFDGKERSSVLFTNEGQTMNVEGKNRSSESHVASEDRVSERPKLKLLPRTKPLEISEPSIIEDKQGVQQPNNATKSVQQPNNATKSVQQPNNATKSVQQPLTAVKGVQLPVNANHPDNVRSQGNGIFPRPGIINSEVGHAKPVLSSSENANRIVERPKLNLKPRSHPADKPKGSTEAERVALFGGARPREAVLKDRGVDDVVINHDETQGPRRIINDIPRTEVEPVHTSTARHVERVPNSSNDHRSGRGHEKKEQRAVVQKADMQRKNWRNENWRNSGEAQKQHQQERPPSPETWRKPVEQPRSANDNSGLRFGKAVSAVELAQAFSSPASDPKQVDRFSGQRGLPGRTQIPFSRLAGSTTRPHINGY